MCMSCSFAFDPIVHRTSISAFLSSSICWPKHSSSENRRHGTLLSTFAATCAVLGLWLSTQHHTVYWFKDCSHLLSPGGAHCHLHPNLRHPRIILTSSGIVSHLYRPTTYQAPPCCSHLSNNLISDWQLPLPSPSIAPAVATGPCRVQGGSRGIYIGPWEASLLFSTPPHLLITSTLHTSTTKTLHTPSIYRDEFLLVKMSHQSGGGGSRASAGNARGSAAPTQQLQRMNIQGRVAVDGSPLTMDASVAVPKANPMTSLQVHPKEPKKVLDTVQGSGMTHAEFPLREAITNPNTTVYTNHFVVKVDDTKPLYEYNITGLPRQASTKTAKKLVQALIDRTPALVANANQTNFATDFARTLVSWVKLSDQNLKAVQSTEWRAPIYLGLQYASRVDTDLLSRYVQGKIEPTKV